MDYNGRYTSRTRNSTKECYTNTILGVNPDSEDDVDLIKVPDTSSSWEHVTSPGGEYLSFSSRLETREIWPESPTAEARDAMDLGHEPTPNPDTLATRPWTHQPTSVSDSPGLEHLEAARELTTQRVTNEQALMNYGRNFGGQLHISPS